MTFERHSFVKKIDQINGAIVVREPGSKKDTFVNAVHVTERHVMPGDKLTVGQTKFHAQYEHRREGRV